MLAFTAGNPEHPVNAIPPAALAHCQLRFVVGTDWTHLGDHLRRHLDARGLAQVEVEVAPGQRGNAPSPRQPVGGVGARFTRAHVRQEAGIAAQSGRQLPNDAFAEILGMPTIWIPHSYPACSQHAPGEHLLGSVAREGLQLMAVMFWDLGEGAPVSVRKPA